MTLRDHWGRDLLGVEPVDNGDGTETVTWPERGSFGLRELTEDEMSVTFPRRRGFRVAWAVLRATFLAYRLHRPTVQFVIRGGSR